MSIVVKHSLVVRKNIVRTHLFLILLIGFCYGQLFELNHDNDTRIYWVDYPDNATEPTPLVISMHGRNQSLLSHITYSQMSNFANPQNIAVVYPQGINSSGLLAWNTGVWWDNSEYDDVGYLNAIIDSVISNFAIDTNRIYACGMSNGGFMAYELACELSDRVVAFGSVSGNFMMNIDQDCTNEREIPIMHIHGTSDLLVNYYPPTIDSSMTAMEAMDWWSTENNLTEQLVEELNDSVNVFTNSSLISNTKFVHFQVEGGGHKWFNYNWGFHASEELLSFFMQYSMMDFSLSSIESEFVPKKFALLQNHPNPFNPITTLRYDLPENSRVNIIIYDMLGREEKTLINQTQDAGYKSVIWDATNDYGKPVSAGIYLYQVQAGEYMQTKKMVLLK